MRRLRSTALGAAVLAAAVLAATAAAQPKPGASRPATSAAPNVAAAASAPPGGGYSQRFAEQCAACHGASGRSDMPGTPVIAGQPAFYAITQLFLFREGRRDNVAMTTVAKTLKDADLRGFSEYIGTLAPVPGPPPDIPPDPARMARGNALAQQHKCLFCHGQELEGGSQVPRIAGQHEDYLQASLQGFKSGQRPGYTQAMTAAVSQISAEELDTLAYYVARFSVPAPTSPRR